MAEPKDDARKAARYGDAEVSVGPGGETHQAAGDGRPTLTTQQGVPVADDQNTLRAGARGPALLEDFHFREKIFHFDHERIPERVVHARGFGVHGYFENYESLADVTRADLFQRKGEKTPVFVRFSTVAGSKGSPDLARDVRGFATKFYTKEGNWDLVGNNIPVFFIQDPIKFPDMVHAVKPEPDRGFPQAADRPRQLLGLHLAHAREHAHDHVGHVRPGDPAVVPVHGGLRRPHLPAGQRRGQVDLRQVPLEAEAGAAVGRLERGGQDQRGRPRLPPPRPLGRHRGRRLPRVGAGPAALRRGVRREVRLRRPRRDQDHPRGGGAGAAASAGWCSTAASTTSSPRPSRSPSARRTSSPGSTSPTTRSCRGGTSPTSTPSSSGSAARTSPTSRSTPRSARSRTSSRTGTWRCATPRAGSTTSRTPGRASRRARASRPRRASAPIPSGVEAPKVRARSETFADHYSQARQFYISQTEIEQKHIANALIFELSKVETPAIRPRMVSHLLNIDEGLAKTVAEGLRLKEMPEAGRPPARPTRKDLKPSAALSILKNGPKSFAGRKVGALVTDGVDADLLAALRKALKAEGAMLKLVAPEVGGVKDSAGTWHDADEKLEGGPVGPVRRRGGPAVEGRGRAAGQAAGGPRLRRRRHGAPEVHRLLGRRRPAVREGGRRRQPRRGLHPAQGRRRLRPVRRRLPQAPLLGPQGRRTLMRPAWPIAHLLFQTGSKNSGMSGRSGMRDVRSAMLSSGFGRWGPVTSGPHRVARPSHPSPAAHSEEPR